MTITIARAARIRFADTTAPLAQAVINAKFAAIIEHLDDIAVYEHTCELCGHGTDETFTRLDENLTEVEICETCADTADVYYVAD